jgi:hypothetical protein
MPQRLGQYGRDAEPTRQGGELPTIHVHKVDFPERDCVVTVQDGIRLAENQRQQRRPGHTDRVSEGEQLADVIRSVAQPPFGRVLRASRAACARRDQTSAWSTRRCAATPIGEQVARTASFPHPDELTGFHKVCHSTALIRLTDTLARAASWYCVSSASLRSSATHAVTTMHKGATNRKLRRLGTGSSA